MLNKYRTDIIILLHQYRLSDKNQARLNKLYRFLVFVIKVAIRCLKYIWLILIQTINLCEAVLVKFNVIKREALLDIPI